MNGTTPPVIKPRKPVDLKRKRLRSSSTNDNDDIDLQPSSEQQQQNEQQKHEEQKDEQQVKKVVKKQKNNRNQSEQHRITEMRQRRQQILQQLCAQQPSQEQEQEQESQSSQSLQFLSHSLKEKDNGDDEKEQKAENEQQVIAGTESPIFDMFSLSDNSPTTDKSTKMMNVEKPQTTNTVAQQQQHLAANWDDEESYYKFSISEILFNDDPSYEEYNTIHENDDENGENDEYNGENGENGEQKQKSAANKYRIVGTYGKGVFSVVLKAVLISSGDDDEEEENGENGSEKNGKDKNRCGENEGERNRTNEKFFAIKMIRNNESMRKSGLYEIELLKTLYRYQKQQQQQHLRQINVKKAVKTGHSMSKKQKLEEKHVGEVREEHFGDSFVQLRHSFMYRNHLCLVFDALDVNLRQILDMYGQVGGKKMGIRLEAVRTYAKQLFQALVQLKNCAILHADIKPDNILIVDREWSNSRIKLGDFGSACLVNQSAITPYLVSRFYRAPEVILGMKYDFGIDVWSVGCTLYELYTGHILFQSRDNNDQLRCIMEYKGKISNKMLNKCLLKEHHFDAQNRFMYRDGVDPISGKLVIRTVEMPRKTKDLKTDLLNATVHVNEDERVRKQVVQLADLLERTFVIDPAKRITAQQALEHPFFAD